MTLWSAARAVPILTEVVVLFTLGRVTQNFIGLVDLFKFFFGDCFILRYVGVIFAGQFSKGFANIVIRGGARDTKNLVVVFKLDSHSSFAFETNFGSICPNVKAL